MEYPQRTIYQTQSSDDYVVRLHHLQDTLSRSRNTFSAVLQQTDATLARIQDAKLAAQLEADPSASAQQQQHLADLSLASAQIGQAADLVANLRLPQGLPSNKEASVRVKCSIRLVCLRALTPPSLQDRKQTVTQDPSAAHDLLLSIEARTGQSFETLVNASDAFCQALTQRGVMSDQPEWSEWIIRLASCTKLIQTAQRTPTPRVEMAAAAAAAMECAWHALTVARQTPRATFEADQICRQINVDYTMFEVYKDVLDGPPYSFREMYVSTLR